MSLFKKIISFVSALLLGGCASLSTSDASFRLVTQYAVLKFIEQTPADQRADKIQRIEKFVSVVKAHASGETSLELLQQAISKEMDAAGLSSADRLLADALVLAITDEARARIGSGVLNPDQLLAVTKVLDWVLAAARMPA